MILHWKNCTNANCFLCGALKRSTVFRSNNSNPSSSRYCHSFSSCLIVRFADREWQQRLHQDHRSHLVRKIASTLLSTIQQDGSQMPHDRLATINNYAQQTEADTYNTATSYEDYFQRLAERIYRIQRDHEEKQTLKKQPSLTASLASIDKSAGEQGPPNRIAPPMDYSTSFTATEIKSEPMENQPASGTVAADKHRMSANGLTRLSVQTTTNANGPMHTEINGNHMDTSQVKNERISPRGETRTQVRSSLSPFRLFTLSFFFRHRHSPNRRTGRRRPPLQTVKPLLLP